MAIYRAVQMSFWSDTKILEDFTADEKYFYLYCLTNPHTNLCGCYELGISQISFETALDKAKVKKLIDALKVKGVLDYSADTYELLIVNWHKYNWTASAKFRQPLENEINAVKDNKFKEYLQDMFNGTESVYRIDTVSDNDDTVSEKKKKPKEPEKWAYGEEKNVMLTDAEYNKLIEKYGQELTAQAITKLDNYLLEPRNKNKYKSHYAAMLNWVFKAVEEDNIRQGRKQNTQDINDYLMQQATGGMV